MKPHIFESDGAMKHRKTKPLCCLSLVGAHFWGFEAKGRESHIFLSLMANRNKIQISGGGEAGGNKHKTTVLFNY